MFDFLLTNICSRVILISQNRCLSYLFSRDYKGFYRMEVIMMRNYKFIVPCVIIAFMMGLLVMSGIRRISASPARTQAANIREKHVVSVMVEENDSIWSIAEQYYTEECGSMKDYIAEIKKCNSITTDTIYAGRPLIVPVWASDAELPALEKSL